MSFHNPLAIAPQSLKTLPMQTMAFSSVGSGYTNIGSTFGSGVIMLIIVSTLNQPVQIRLDGVNDFIPVLAGASIVLDARSDGGAFPASFSVDVKEIGSAPASGNLYVGLLSV